MLIQLYCTSPNYRNDLSHVRSDETMLTATMPGLLLPASSNGISAVGSYWAREAELCYRWLTSKLLVQLCEPNMGRREHRVVASTSSLTNQYS